MLRAGLVFAGANVKDGQAGAMLEVRERRRKAGGVAHPFFWGSFILIGNPD